MNEQMRNDLTPQGYIRHMFAETENGVFTYSYETIYNNISDKRFYLEWTTEDEMEEAIERYNVLVSALTRLGRMHDELEDEDKRNELLSESDLQVWNTYVHPYEPLEVDWDELGIPPCNQAELFELIESARERAFDSDLFEEEEYLLKKFYMWKEEQSQKRIPFNRRSSADLITRAARYESFISLGAPELVVTEEGRCLAEELVLYYYGKEEPIIWE